MGNNSRKTSGEGLTRDRRERPTGAEGLGVGRKGEVAINSFDDNSEILQKAERKLGGGWKPRVTKYGGGKRVGGGDYQKSQRRKKK